MDDVTARNRSASATAGDSAVQRPADRGAPGAGPVTPEPAGRRPGTILLVDDHTQRVNGLVGALRQAGCHVLVTADGPTASVLAETTHPNLIILNLLLPDNAGIEVQRAVHRRCATPILLMGNRWGRLDPPED